ncbi:3'(2'),5'-bisphosphate nucleotidase [Thalassoroseus pseudoceratinae]|uniref:3'(2'),5'-bisphosphate nucleotidase n=1 Tax=Thalassoroseus pseudoceratinae TaxID=2713176 RepID=UPI001F0F6838|nr:3'(2'),5'-bisphosphate nucleotidase [Thalassoroseus pseudoceratinae]
MTENIDHSEARGFDMYEAELAVGIDAVRQAMSVCEYVQAQVTPEAMEKRDKSPVTIADFASQAVICRSLGLAFPADPIVAEEDSAALKEPEQKPFLDRIEQELTRAGIQGTVNDIYRWIDQGNSQSYCNRFWTLDPIDGTKGFLRGEQYAVSLALIVEGMPTVAVLGCPNLKTADGQSGVIFSAVSGRGASCQHTDENGSPQPIRVRETSDLTQSQFCESVESGHSKHDWSAQIAETLGIVADPVRMDSQAKYAAVARGDADIYLRLPTRPGYREKIWDHAGGVLVVQEAGGTVTDIDGKPLDFTHGMELATNQGVVVTTGHHHEKVIAAIQQTKPKSNK